jgi:hypothetical protein
MRSTGTEFYFANLAVEMQTLLQLGKVYKTKTPEHCITLLVV